MARHRILVVDDEENLRDVLVEVLKRDGHEVQSAGELYDLESDPDEMNNRFNDPGLHNLQREMTAMIMSRPDDAI